MGTVGLVALALLAAGPVTQRIGGAAVAGTTTRLTRIALLLAVLSVPAVLTDVAHGLDESGAGAGAGADRRQAACRSPSWSTRTPC